MELGTRPGRRRRAAGIAVKLAACLLAAALATPAASAGAAGDTAAGDTATSGTEDPASYVALGDSFTAGPGIPDQIPESGGCARSDHNYPHLVAAALSVDRFTDVSCGGATTEHMAQAQPLPGGLTNGPQFDALSADVDLVSVGIGGNDIGFAEIILTCAAHSLLLPITAPCRNYYTRHGDELGARIDATAPKVATVLAAIRDRAPGARILVVGYPVILPDRGPGCWPLVPIAIGDVAWLRTVQGRLNTMLADEAARAGAHFVDTYSSSVGHDVCRLPGRKWVEGFIPTAPAAPVHPNALGMANTAEQVLETIAALRTRSVR
ncbi:MAG TPA: SGNH/GDSL hydrolase family protein [Acidimicrobiia bacterium]|nr:SGNH/GDSL hydrolase family protein [Acidimicrobiia bacterium]